MAKKIKKGVKGERSQYLTRSKAIRKLQVSLKDFRRLCILKGIYPREPKKKFEGTNKTYYHIKDIKILLHDNLLTKFREIKAHLKKHKKLLGRKEKKTAEEHLKKIPKYNLSNIIKERYPSFLDALRDLDDALCLISLYANLPQHQTLEISKQDIQNCQKMSKEFMLYCTITQCFKKCFYSIKGIYYQVEIMGQSITWIQPYQFNQRLPFDIDYKVMNTFLEFYQALLKFMNFKLFSDLGIKYPLEQEFYKESHLDVTLVQHMQAMAIKKFDEAQNSDQQFQISEEFKETPEMKQISLKQEKQKKQRTLFSKYNFFLNRETPIYSLQYLILSFGGSFLTEDDEQEKSSKKLKITHHVLDRPLLGKMDPNKEYIQPQWIVDSVNNLFLLPTGQYKPGVPPPPHLSPFVDNVSEGYIPNRQKEINSLKGEEIQEIDEEELSEEEVEQIQKAQKKGKEQKEQQGKQEDPVKAKKQGKVKGDEDSSSEEEDSEEEDEKQKKVKNLKLKKDLKKEQEELGKILMSKKQRRLYEEMEKSKKSKKEQVQKLKEKKKKLQKK